MAAITGRVEVWVDGKKMLNKSGARASGIGESGKSPVSRKGVMVDSGIAGYVEEIIPARCEITIVDRDDVSLSDLAAINGSGTVIFKAAGGSGKVYTMKNATCLGDLSLTAGEGDTEVVFEGDYWTEEIQ